MKYRKKPVVIDAVQWFPSLKNDNVKKRVCPDNFNNKCSKCGCYTDEHGDIITLEGKGGAQEVCPGDWIITGVRGESYPCKPDIFEMTYEKV